MLLYVAESSTGGIADYSRHQILALLEAGASLRVLCRPDYPRRHELPGEVVIPDLP